MKMTYKNNCPLCGGKIILIDSCAKVGTVSEMAFPFAYARWKCLLCGTEFTAEGGKIGDCKTKIQRETEIPEIKSAGCISGERKIF